MGVRGGDMIGRWVLRRSKRKSIDAAKERRTGVGVS